MTKELHDGVEFLDGEPVEIYEGRFTGSFDIGDDGISISTDDLVCYLVTARVSAPKFSFIRKSGKLKRTNSHTIESAIKLTPEKAMYLLDSIGAKVNGVNDGLVEFAVTEEEKEEAQTSWINVPALESAISEPQPTYDYGKMHRTFTQVL
jgi:hypothetical protein